MCSVWKSVVIDDEILYGKLEHETYSMLGSD